MALAEALADLALQEGLDALSLRPAAAQLGTSDRMLLYYFESKARLVTDVLGVVSARLASKLAIVPPSANLSPTRIMEIAGELLSEPEVRPFMALWAEIVARAVRQEDIYSEIGRRISEGWVEWIVMRTEFPQGLDTNTGARTMLSMIEAMSNRRLMDAGDVDPSITLSLARALLGE